MAFEISDVLRAAGYTAIGSLGLFSVAMCTFLPALVDRIQLEWIADGAVGKLSAEGLKRRCTRFRIASASFVAGMMAYSIAFFWASGGQWTPLIIAWVGWCFHCWFSVAIEGYERWRGSYLRGPAIVLPAQPPEPKLKPKPQPMPRKEPPRLDPRVRWLKGPRSHVPGEFYLDQDTSDRALVGLLRKYGLKVLTTCEAGNKGADDLTQLKFSTSRRMILITRDAGFKRKHKSGMKHAGIMHVPHGAEWYQEILRVCLRLTDEMAEE